MPRSWRQAATIPIVLVVLMIFVTLGATFYLQGRAGYRQTALAGYRLRLQLFLVSALDEARTRLFQFTDPVAASQGYNIKEPAIRDLLLGQLPNPYSVDDPYSDAFENEIQATQAKVFQVPLTNFNGKPILWATRAIMFADAPRAEAVMGKIQVEDARAYFHSFRPVQYTKEGLLTKRAVYFRNSYPFGDPIYRPLDWMGYCTIVVRASLVSDKLKMSRSFAVTHDVKLVDTAPIGREFNLYSFASPIGDTKRMTAALNLGGTNGTFNAQTKEPDLNRLPTGRLITYSNYVGRQYVQGPYLFNTEGPGTDGMGGETPQVSPAFPSPKPDWGGWSQIPSPRALILPWQVGWSWESPVRPQRSCTHGGSFVAGGLEIAVLTYDDPVGYGAGDFYFAAGSEVGRQRFYPAGEPQYFRQASGGNKTLLYGSSGPELGTSGFRGLLTRIGEDGTPEFLQWNPGGSGGSWSEKDLQDTDQFAMEPAGPFGLGLYQPVKFYPFVKGEDCGDYGTLETIGNSIESFGSFLTEAITIYKTTHYYRKPRGRNATAVAGIPSVEPTSEAELDKLLDLTGSFIGSTGQGPADWDPQLFQYPFAYSYQVSKTQGWQAAVLGSLLTVGSFALGAGAGAIVGKMVAKTLLRGAASMTLGQTVTAVGAGFAADAGVGIGAEIAFRPGINNMRDREGVTGGTATVVDGTITAEDLEAVADSIPRSEVRELTPEEQAAKSLAESKFRHVNQQLVSEGFQDAIQGGMDVLAAYMSGTLSGFNPGAFEQWKLSVNNYSLGQFLPTDIAGDDGNGDKWMRLEGFLPPGLRPMMRLSTKRYPRLQDALVQGELLRLEGVTSVDRLSDEGSMVGQMGYVGRGILYSGANYDLDPEYNMRPNIGGDILPLDTTRDHLTLVYWPKIPSAQASDPEGTGMLTLGGDMNWGTFVGPYGVRPLQEKTTIMGNLVTGYLDRHRYPNNSNLRVFYNYRMLYPAAENIAAGSPPDGQLRPPVPAGQDPWGQHPAFFKSMTVSPKVCGWYDALQ